MKLAYVTLFDATDIRNWSGTYWYMLKSLERQGVQVELIGNLEHGRSLPRRLRKLWARNVEKRDFLHFWDLDTARDYSADVDRRLSKLDVDAVLCVNPIPLAYLQSKLPKILWTDAGYSGLSQVYDGYSEKALSRASNQHATEIDLLAMKNSDLLMYASDWGAECAVEAGSIEDREKVKVVPFGANLSISHTADDIRGMVADRSSNIIKLLFVGVDWSRKGAEKATLIASKVHEAGLEVDLTMVGCSPTDGFVVPSFVRIIENLVKSVPADAERLHKLYAGSHFLIVPTMAEAFGLVFAEASAFGLPSLSHRVAGVPTVVRDDRNGYLFDIDDPLELWSEKIISLYQDRARMLDLAVSSFKEYSSRLNWDVAGDHAMRHIDALVNSRL